MQADFVEAEGTRLFVRRRGAGTRCALYWHGGGGASTEWPEIAPALVQAGYTVYGPDAPGYGQSPPLEPNRYHASEIAGLGIALIDALGIAPAIWIGFSWGASIGVHAAVRYPDHVRALVLLDGGYLLPEDDPSDDPSLDFAGRMEAWRRELEEQEDEDEAPIGIVAAAMAGSNVEPAVPLLPRLAATGIPALLIAATEPPAYHDLRERALARFRAGLPSAEVVRVRAGHGVLQEAGADVRRHVLDWLARLD